MYQSRKSLENFMIFLVDLIGLTISFGLAFWIRHGVLFGRQTKWDQIWIPFLAIIVYFLVSLFINSTYHFFRRGYFEEIVSILRTNIIAFGSFVVVVYVLHRSNELSRLVLGYSAVIATALLYALRILFKQYMLRVYKRSRNSSRMLIVTTSERAKEVLDNLNRYQEWYRQVVGLVLTDGTAGESINGIDIVAGKEDFIDYTIRNDIDEVFIIDDTIVHTEILREWVVELEQMGITVNVNIDEFDITDYGKRTLGRVGRYAVVSYARNLFTERQLIAKRILDIVGSLVGMVILAVATIFVAPAIMLESPGPVFFGQTRVGKNGRKFTFYKFRSMYRDAEERKKELMKHNEVNGLMFKMTDDPRITKVGKFIRKTSIDELPQFWNILRGDMSLVGTRPPTVDEFERYEAKHKCRLSMTPGLTGMWQISGRSDIKDFDEVVKLDMQYIDDWTILKDIKILLLTVKVVLLGKGSR